jgi:hypothetical protein
VHSTVDVKYFELENNRRIALSSYGISSNHQAYLRSTPLSLTLNVRTTTLSPTNKDYHTSARMPPTLKFRHECTIITKEVLPSSTLQLQLTDSV